MTLSARAKNGAIVTRRGNAVRSDSPCCCDGEPGPFPPCFCPDGRPRIPCECLPAGHPDACPEINTCPTVNPEDVATCCAANPSARAVIPAGVTAWVVIDGTSQFTAYRCAGSPCNRKWLFREGNSTTRVRHSFAPITFCRTGLGFDPLTTHPGVSGETKTYGLVSCMEQVQLVGGPASRGSTSMNTFTPDLSVLTQTTGEPCSFGATYADGVVAAGWRGPPQSPGCWPIGDLATGTAAYGGFVNGAPTYGTATVHVENAWNPSSICGGFWGVVSDSTVSAYSGPWFSCAAALRAADVRREARRVVSVPGTLVAPTPEQTRAIMRDRKSGGCSNCGEDGGL